MDDVGSGPVGIDTAIFIYYIEESDNISSRTDALCGVAPPTVE